MTGGEDLIDNVTLGKERVGKGGREWGTVEKKGGETLE